MKKKLNRSDAKNWKRSSASELLSYKKAIEKKLNVKLGPPFKSEKLKHIPISIKLDPLVLKKFKQRSKKTGIPYQTLINTALKDAA